ncbi:hypothetical protein G7009_02050 [Pseudomonas capeferrum]|uniref:hypothetical protein n=1 Tax=Pseudomonas capeferrum TaxID=1495066 RepID=UPI0015E3B71F|nr:hypothetical protein [Pseudomonas capeferrum]MBA1200580.1 hypothetical protein [Pseudomonas capeferrum]
MNKDTGATPSQQHSPGEVPRDNDALRPAPGEKEDGNTTAQRTGKREGEAEQGRKIPE